ncbi:hypothetical protein [Streptomyces sp. NPDC059761]|uniref:hypothetical protein n=1 Tax=Streptomyces sp. NPDC059761 TaxID=3346937 RepID=UPI00365D514C
MHFVYGDGMARFQDHSYAVYEAAGFTGRDLDWAVNTAYTFVAGSAIDEAVTAAMTKARIRPGRGAEIEAILHGLEARLARRTT